MFVNCNVQLDEANAYSNDQIAAAAAAVLAACGGDPSKDTCLLSVSVPTVTVGVGLSPGPPPSP